MADERAVVQVRREIARRVQGQEEVDTPTLTGEVMDWLDGNPGVQRAFLRESLYGLVQDVATDVFRAKRRRPLVIGDKVVPADRLDAKAKETRALRRYQEWYESAGGVRKPLLKMTRVDLDDVIKERSAQTATDVAGLAFLREVRSRLTSDEEEVGARFKVTELAQIETRYFSKRDHLLNEALGAVWHAAVKVQQGKRPAAAPVTK